MPRRQRQNLPLTCCHGLQVSLGFQVIPKAKPQQGLTGYSQSRLRSFLTLQAPRARRAWWPQVSQPRAWRD